MADPTSPPVPPAFLDRVINKLLGLDETGHMPAPAAPAKPVPRGSSSAPAPRPTGGGARRDQVLDDAMKASGV